MIIKDEEQRGLLLAILEFATYQGNMIDKVYELKKDIINAKIEKEVK